MTNSCDHELLYLSAADVAVIDLPMRVIIDAVEDAFRLKGLGKVEMPPRPDTAAWL